MESIKVRMKVPRDHACDPLAPCVLKEGWEGKVIITGTGICVIVGSPPHPEK